MTNEFGPPSEVVATRIKEVRQRRGWTAATLAERCGQIGADGITAQTIANIETGRKDENGRRRRNVTVDELLAFARALDVAPVHLLVPLDEGAYRMLPRSVVKVGVVRQWVRGNEPLPKGDRRLYFFEVPEHEWEAPPPPDWTEDDKRKLAELLERAERAGVLKVESGDDGRN